MQKAMALVLLLIYTASFTEFGELLKIGHLATHYNAHQKENPKLGFTDFLCCHYLSDDEARETAHHNLPFKNHNTAPHQPISAFTCVAVFHLQIPIFSSFENTSSMELPYKYLSVFNIWHPPKVV